MSTPEISIIIPALNEEINIKETLTEISKHQNIAKSQVIVIDNGSFDQTAMIAESLGAEVLVEVDATIAALRNIGTTHARNEVIAFIDADITLDKKWFEEIASKHQILTKNPLTVTGHRVIPSQDNFISKYWFSTLARKTSKQNYINSGNLITTKKMITLAGGFSENLITGEDHDFCQKAIKYGGDLNPNSNFIAWHRGYPENIFTFIKRESWHGSQDTKSISSIIHSKTALISLANLILMLISISLSVANLSFLPMALYFTVFLLLSTFLAIQKTGFRPISHIPASTLIASAYISGRTISYIKNPGRHRQHGTAKKSAKPTISQTAQTPGSKAITKNNKKKIQIAK